METNHFPDINLPVYNPQYLGISYPPNRPQGYLKTTWLHRKLEKLGEHAKMAFKSNVNTIKSLTGKPLTVQELKYKLSNDVKDKTLMGLSTFLQLPNVIKEGITPSKVGKYVTPSPLVLVPIQKLGCVRHQTVRTDTQDSV